MGQCKGLRQTEWRGSGPSKSTVLFWYFLECHKIYRQPDVMTQDFTNSLWPYRCSSTFHTMLSWWPRDFSPTTSNCRNPQSGR